jgi:hypothetical protein
MRRSIAAAAIGGAFIIGLAAGAGSRPVEEASPVPPPSPTPVYWPELLGASPAPTPTPEVRIVTITPEPRYECLTLLGQLSESMSVVTETFLDVLDIISDGLERGRSSDAILTDIVERVADLEDGDWEAWTDAAYGVVEACR